MCLLHPRQQQHEKQLQQKSKQKCRKQFVFRLIFQEEEEEEENEKKMWEKKKKISCRHLQIAIDATMLVNEINLTY